MNGDFAMENERWDATESVLERIKHSCFAMHLLYRRRYFQAKKRLSLYDVPIIGLSAINSVLIAGGKDFVPAQILQITTCLLAVVVGIIQSIKNYFKIDESRESCLVTYKDLFRMFCEISMLLDQPRHWRGVDPQKYTIDKGNEYQAIMSQSLVLDDERSKRNPIYEDSVPYLTRSSGLSNLFRSGSTRNSTPTTSVVERSTSTTLEHPEPFEVGITSTINV